MERGWHSHPLGTYTAAFLLRTLPEFTGTTSDSSLGDDSANSPLLPSKRLPTKVLSNLYFSANGSNPYL